MRELKKILYIDDDTVMRMMVQKSLERTHKDFIITCCAQPSEFIDLCTSFKPDLLIIDVVMPTLKGPELLSRLRRLGIRIPAIFITGQEMIDFENREVLEPILGIIQKPFSPSALGKNLTDLWLASRST